MLPPRGPIDPSVRARQHIAEMAAIQNHVKAATSQKMHNSIEMPAHPVVGARESGNNKIKKNPMLASLLDGPEASPEASNSAPPPTTTSHSSMLLSQLLESNDSPAAATAGASSSAATSLTNSASLVAPGVKSPPAMPGANAVTPASVLNQAQKRKRRSIGDVSANHSGAGANQLAAKRLASEEEIMNNRSNQGFVSPNSIPTPPANRPNALHPTNMQVDPRLHAPAQRHAPPNMMNHMSPGPGTMMPTHMLTQQQQQQLNYQHHPHQQMNRAHRPGVMPPHLQQAQQQQQQHRAAPMANFTQLTRVGGDSSAGIHHHNPVSSSQPFSGNQQQQQQQQQHVMTSQQHLTSSPAAGHVSISSSSPAAAALNFASSAQTTPPPPHSHPMQVTSPHPGIRFARPSAMTSALQTPVKQEVDTQVHLSSAATGFTSQSHVTTVANTAMGQAESVTVPSTAGALANNGPFRAPGSVGGNQMQYGMLNSYSHMMNSGRIPHGAAARLKFNQSEPSLQQHQQQQQQQQHRPSPLNARQRGNQSELVQLLNDTPDYKTEPPATMATNSGGSASSGFQAEFAKALGQNLSGSDTPGSGGLQRQSAFDFDPSVSFLGQRSGVDGAFDVGSTATLNIKTEQQENAELKAALRTDFALQQNHVKAPAQSASITALQQLEALAEVKTESNSVGGFKPSYPRPLQSGKPLGMGAYTSASSDSHTDSKLGLVSTPDGGGTSQESSRDSDVFAAIIASSAANVTSQAALQNSYSVAAIEAASAGLGVNSVTKSSKKSSSSGTTRDGGSERKKKKSSKHDPEVRQERKRKKAEEERRRAEVYDFDTNEGEHLSEAPIKIKIKVGGQTFVNASTADKKRLSPLPMKSSRGEKTKKLSKHKNKSSSQST